MSVSTSALIFLSPSSAFVPLLFPSKLKGLVMIATVRIHIPFAIFAMTGAAHVPVHPHIQQVMNTMSVSWSIFFISLSLSSAAFLPISGFPHAPSHLVRLSPIFIFFSAKFVARSCASVLMATKLTPSKPSETILFSALFPQPPIHITFIFAPGMNSGLIS